MEGTRGVTRRASASRGGGRLSAAPPAVGRSVACLRLQHVKHVES